MYALAMGRHMPGRLQVLKHNCYCLRKDLVHSVSIGDRTLCGFAIDHRTAQCYPFLYTLCWQNGADSTWCLQNRISPWNMGPRVLIRVSTIRIVRLLYTDEATTSAP